MKYPLLLALGGLLACGPSPVATNPEATATTAPTLPATQSESAGPRQFRGALEGGMKGDSIFFNLSEDGRRLSGLTFKGYWRCAGKLEQTLVGPEGSFDVQDGKVKGAIVEPPGGGSTAWRFELETDIRGNIATGSFRMNINNLGCDTYKLSFTAKGD